MSAQFMPKVSLNRKICCHHKDAHDPISKSSKVLRFKPEAVASSCELTCQHTPNQLKINVEALHVFEAKHLPRAQSHWAPRQ